MEAQTTTVVLALVGILGTVITALFKLLNANTKALTKMAESSDKMVASTEKVALATETGNAEAKQRNGHLGEQNVQIAQAIASQSSDLKSIRDSSNRNYVANAATAASIVKSAVIAAEDRGILTGGSPQVVHEQTVEHQIINSK